MKRVYKVRIHQVFAQIKLLDYLLWYMRFVWNNMLKYCADAHYQGSI
ncbi:helix-turn-helix domain-containing protein [Nitrosococcus oceani]|nr:helix-turn-helix domain-containing protein [Nitrosococcus oceani]